MKSLRSFVDRWRRGPELRAFQKCIEEGSAELAALRQQLADASHHLGEGNEAYRLLREFLRLGLPIKAVKARCSDCGGMTFKWELRLDTVSRALFALCDTCLRVRARAAGEAAAPRNGQEVAPGPEPEAQAGGG